jgi:hypothetical protein
MAGYRVETSDGLVGVLDGSLRDEQGRARSLVVAQGWFGRRRLEIPLEEVARVDHRGGRIVLVAGAGRPDPPPTWRRLALLLANRARRALSGAPSSDGRREAPVVCGVDGEADVWAVIAVAAALSRRLSVPLVVTGVSPPELEPGSAPPRRARPGAAKGAARLVDALVSEAASGADIRRVVDASPATLAELASSEKASLVVVGPGFGGAGAATTSLEPETTRRPPCPIVVVPPRVGSSLSH